MTTRREFIQVAAAISLAESVSASGMARPDEHYLPIATVLYDERFVAGQEFANEARNFGLQTLAIRHDVTSLWRTQLRQRWRSAPLVMAGLTSEFSCFVLNQLGWSHGLRLVSYSECPVAADQQMAQAEWGASMARQIGWFPRAAQRVQHRLMLPASKAAASTMDGQMLTCWVLAPAARDRLRLHADTRQAVVRS